MSYTQEELDYRGDDPWDYFDKEAAVQRFVTNRQHAMVKRVNEGKLPVWTKELEMALVNQVHLNYYGEPYVAISWTEPELNVDALMVRPVNRRPLPAFKLPYSKYEEIKLRLDKTMITIKGNPFYIRAVKARNGKFWLNLVDTDGKAWCSKYDDIPDLRTPPSMYLAEGGVTGWLQRIPERVYQQGLNRNNAHLRALSKAGAIRNFHPETTGKAIATRVDRKWNSGMVDLMSDGTLRQVRLTDHVAVGAEGLKTIAFYKGRTLGTVKEDCVILQDEDDLLQDWIIRDAREAGFVLRAA